MGVTVVPARRLPGLLRSLPPTLTPQRAREVAAQMNRRIDAYTGQPVGTNRVPATEGRLTVPAVVWSSPGSGDAR